MPTFRPDKLRLVVAQVFRACGVDEPSAGIVADHLVEADMCGVGSHGVIRVPQYVQAIETGKVVPNATIRIVRQSAGTAVLDGRHGFGQVMAHEAMKFAIGKARQVGVAAVTLFNCGHTGRLAGYTGKAAESGLLAMMMVNAGGSGQWVAPFGGTQARLATNPVSFAVPSGSGSPLVVDFATSATPEGTCTGCTQCRPTVAGWVDRRPQGKCHDVACRFVRSAARCDSAFRRSTGAQGLRPGDDRRRLCRRAFSGAGACRRDSPHDSMTDGVFIVAIDPSFFGPTAEFVDRVRALVEHVTSSPPAPGVDRVYVPGEKEAVAKRNALAEGITIDAGVWAAIKPSFERFGVAL